ncbi:MAG: pirin family protein [Bacteroidota bacterium]
MKYILRPDQERIHNKDDWKTSAYSFIPYQTHFGELCGFADDIVNGGEGFGMHPHQNMEISTIIISGAQAHKDNTGTEEVITENCIQTMSAGTGLMHSEYNASRTEAFHSFQIWVYPKKENVKPRYEKFTYQPSAKINRVLLALSPDGRNDTALINQESFFSVSCLEKNNSVLYKMNEKNNGVYIHCAKGIIIVEGNILNPGDAIGIYETDSIRLTGQETAELIFVEVPMLKGVKL